ncbi:hypothetical protein ACFPOH_07130 [Ureibacillus suwonensis]|uniref:Coil containing protein n=1 Tax=Ureibacillus suwonensis TaxID=313007 RepID=A0ABW0RCH6_9BACL
MSKERLEEIEERVLVDKVYYKYLDGIKGHWGKVYTLSEGDYNYLKEQAERVQELERKIERYREAINNINEKATLFGTSEEVYDAIQDAIKVLEGTE